MTYFKSPEGMLCDKCFKSSLKKCAGCKEAIADKLYTAFDKFWHQPCFRCCVCHIAFSNMNYVPFRDKAYHLECYQKTMIKPCKVCGKNCTEDYFEAPNGDPVHEGACLEKYKLERDKVKSAADAMHKKWEERLKAEEFKFVPKGEEEKMVYS